MSIGFLRILYFLENGASLENGRKTKMANGIEIKCESCGKTSTDDKIDSERWVVGESPADSENHYMCEECAKKLGARNGFKVGE